MVSLHHLSEISNLAATPDVDTVPLPPNILDDSIIVAKDGGNIVEIIKPYRAKVSEGGCQENRSSRH